MVQRPLVFTVHATNVARQREIEREWIERTVRTPEWTAPDPIDPILVRAFRSIPERDNRVLRVVYVEEAGRIRIISVFFDRGAKRQR